MNASEIIKLLDLQPLSIEGGHFAETYRCIQKTPQDAKSCGTCIYYLLRPKDVSAWHRLKSDEIWFYHAGMTAVQLLLFPDGHFEERHIGANFAENERPQSIIPAETWQTAMLKAPCPDAWGLFSTVVCPGFEFADFEAGKSADLAEKWPLVKMRIQELGLL